MRPDCMILRWFSSVAYQTLNSTVMAESLPRSEPSTEKTTSIGSVFPRPISYLSQPLHALIRAKLWLQILVAMVAGILVGIVIGPTTGAVNPRVAAVIGDWFAFPGLLFLALIQMIVIPLIFASIIRGLAASQDLEQLKQVGLRAGAYFLHDDLRSNRDWNPARECRRTRQVYRRRNDPCSRDEPDSDL